MSHPRSSRQRYRAFVEDFKHRRLDEASLPSGNGTPTDPPHDKRDRRREYVRVTIRPAADGRVEAVKHAQDGAGVITSLTETDGLVELPENTTTVEPGSTVGFLSYAALVG